MSISPLLPMIITFGIALFILGLPFVVLGKLQLKGLVKITILCVLTSVSSASIYVYFSDYSMLEILLFQRNLAYPFGQLILISLGKLLYLSTIIGLTSFALLLCVIIRTLWVKITLNSHSNETPNGAP